TAVLLARPARSVPLEYSPGINRLEGLLEKQRTRQQLRARVPASPKPIVPPAPPPAPPIPRVCSDRLGPRWRNHLLALFGLPSQRRLAQAALQIDRIRHWESEFERLNDVQLKQAGLRLRGRARGGESLDRLLPEAFGLACVAARRTRGMRPF